MKQDTHVKVVRDWCKSLGILTAASMASGEAQAKMAAYIPMLMQRFPDAAFTTDSLQHCAAAAVKGFPTYGELAASLAEHWRANRPQPRALPPPAPRPPRPEPTDAEKEHVARATRELVAELAARMQPEPDVRPTPRYLTPEQLDRQNPLPGGLKRTKQGATS